MTADIPHFEVGLEDRPPSQYTTEDIPALLAVIDDLKRLVAEQQSLDTERQHLITEQQRLIAELSDENAQLKAQIAELTSQLNQNSRNSSRPPSMDGFRRPQTPRKKGERPPGGQKGHKGHTLSLAEPDFVIPHTVANCSHCGASLENVEPISEERRQVFEIPPIWMLVLEHLAERKQCPHCGCIHSAEFPDGVTNHVQYGANLKAFLVYLHVYQLLPYDRTSEMVFDLLGHSISPATVVSAVSECSQNLTGVEETIRKLLQDTSILHVDETGMRVKGTRHWLHVASTDLLTYYRYHRNRGAKATDAMGILPEFHGTVVHDFWSTYFKYSCSHAICNAHLLRELRGITENFRHQWSEALDDLLNEIKIAVDVEKEKRRGLLTPEAIAAFEERYQEILNAGEEETKTSEPPEEPGKRGKKKQSKAKNLLDRCRKYQEDILRFMRDFTVPFTNNQAERDLRMMKLKQKISGTFRSEKGAENFCRTRGFISTIKKHDLPVLAELRDVFKGTPFMPTATHRVA